MNMSAEAKDQLKKETAFERLVRNRGVFLEMTASPGYAEWVEWSKLQVESWKHNALHANTAEEREEARIYYLAFTKFCDMPQFLGQLLQEEVSSDVAS